MYSVRPWLYIGKYRDTLSLPHLQANRIRAMLLLEDKVAQPGIYSLHIPFADGVPFSETAFRRGINFILLEHQLGRNVLIACAAGISRSVTVAIAALKEAEGLPLLAGYEDVLKENVMALPHPVMWRSLCLFYQEDIPYLEVLKRYNKRSS